MKNLKNKLYSLLDNKELLAALALVVVLVLSNIVYSMDSDMLESVKLGDKTLHCYMQDGYKDIEPDMIKDFVDGTWYFVNGSATNCKLK